VRVIVPNQTAFFTSRPFFRLAGEGSPLLWFSAADTSGGLRHVAENLSPIVERPRVAEASPFGHRAMRILSGGVGMGNRIVSRLVVLAMGWIAAASLTWFFCPPPNPPFSHPDAPDSPARIMYPIYCLGFWPVIAYQTITDKR
jgi:hypothetical protein